MQLNGVVSTRLRLYVCMRRNMIHPTIMYLLTQGVAFMSVSIIPFWVRHQMVLLNVAAVVLAL